MPSRILVHSEYPSHATHPKLNMESGLFPTPAAPTHPMLPRRLPGATPESTKVLRKVLEVNHRLNHIIFNDRGFHNHIPHHAIVLWALGAPPEYIQQAYDAEVDAQRPIDYGVTPDVVPVTEENFFEHLGEARYYQSYLRFFNTIVPSMGCARAVEKYVLSPAYNSSRGQMLNRYHAGMIHPCIHVGHGLEFDLPGLIIEGLALTAVQAADPSGDFFVSFNQDFHLNSPPHITSPCLPAHIPRKKNITPHALSFLARIDQNEEYHIPIAAVMKLSFFDKYGPTARAFAQEWVGVNASNMSEDELRKHLWTKVEQIVWMNVVMYAAAGSSKSDVEAEFQSDFFTLVFSSPLYYLHWADETGLYTLVCI
jgi:hypothetical protein